MSRCLITAAAVIGQDGDRATTATGQLVAEVVDLGPDAELPGAELGGMQVERCGGVAALCEVWRRCAFTKALRR